jgi:hypothetical protein
VSYLALSDDTFCLVFDEARVDEVDWIDEEGTERRARLPRVTFARTEESR